MKNNIIFLYIILFSMKAYNQPEGMPVEAGKCYAKCLVKDNQYEKDEIKIFEYTGLNFKNRNIKKKRVITSLESKCIQGAMGIVPEISEEIFIVTDTNKIKEFKIRNVFQNRLVRNGIFEWRQVVCPIDQSSDLILRIKKVLIDEGYEMKLNSIVDKDYKAALSDYQRKFKLPIGVLDYETLKSLGIDIN